MPSSPSKNLIPDAPIIQTPKFWLIGGFLGAGKTTCLMALTKLLQERGRNVGLITNDQGQGLVDSAIGRMGTGGQASVREVIGGCFCCRVGELVSALKDMQTGVNRPDVFLAEPVGSCTDLMATVLLPLQQAYGSSFRKAPMSVVVDAKRAWTQYFGKAGRGGSGFSKDVMYIYLKQLEEAEILVLNKVDLLKPKALADLLTRLRRDWPEKRVLEISAKSGVGCEAWLDVLMAEESRPQRLMAVDYEQYGEGEALLGWYNAKATLNIGPQGKARDGNRLLLRLARAIQEELEANGAVMAHFKMSLESAGQLAVVNAVRPGEKAELSRKLSTCFTAAELLINLRAEAEPKLLDSVVAKHLASLPKNLNPTGLETAAFKPGKPVPVYRATELMA